MKNKNKQIKKSCLVKNSQREVKDVLNTDEKLLIKAKLKDNSAGDIEYNKYH